MALISRFSALVKADAHALLDRLEDPLIVLRQSVREMRSEMAITEQAVSKLEEQVSNLEKQRTDGELAMEQLAGQLDDALGAGRDDLARSVIRHRLQQQLLIDALNRQLVRLNESLSAVQQQYRTQCRQLQMMEHQQQVLDQLQTTGRASSQPEPGLVRAVSREEIELELVRAKNQRAAS